MNQQGTLSYVSGDVTGNFATDKFCFVNAPLNCTDLNFKFLGVYRAVGLQAIRADGVCGLGPAQAAIAHGAD